MDLPAIAITAGIAGLLVVVLGLPLLRFAQRNSALGTRVQMLERDATVHAQDAAEASELRVRTATLQQELDTSHQAAQRSERRTTQVEQESATLRSELETARIAVGSAHAENSALRQRIADRETLDKQAKESFRALSAETLEHQRQSFMQSADASLKEREAAVKKLVEPLSQKVDALEKAREHSQGKLEQQIDTLIKSNSELSNQTQSLSSALTFKPQVRGQWGEMQVERVLELAGLQKGIHYFTQETSDAGRPDFVVKLPNEREIILDSKVSLNAYMDYNRETNRPDAEREGDLDRHAQSMRNHANSLASKNYGAASKNAADYVVMVVPDFALQPAIERDPDLINRSAARQVVICGYSTLHALIKCVAMGWQEATIAEEAMQVAALGKDLHDRIAVFAGHLAKVGSGLNSAIANYNQSVGSFDSRIVPQARRFKELGVSSTSEIASPKPVDVAPRELRNLGAPEAGDGGATDATAAADDAGGTDDAEAHGTRPDADANGAANGQVSDESATTSGNRFDDEFGSEAQGW